MCRYDYEQLTPSQEREASYAFEENRERNMDVQKNPSQRQVQDNDIKLFFIQGYILDAGLSVRVREAVETQYRHH